MGPTSSKQVRSHMSFSVSDLQLQQCLKNEQLLSGMKLCFSNAAATALPINMRYSIYTL